MASTSSTWKWPQRHAASADTESEPFTDDPRLAARIQSGDREAIGAVAHNYLPQILRAARASGLTPQRAEDVTQATFQAFIEAASRFEGRSKVRTFLFGILYRKIAEARRETMRDARTDSIDDVMEGRFRADGKWLQPPKALDQQLFLSEIGQAIDECLDQAPTRQRLAFVLRETEGLSSEELCNILGVSRTNLGVLLFRARNRIRECLESKGITESTK